MKFQHRFRWFVLSLAMLIAPVAGASGSAQERPAPVVAVFLRLRTSSLAEIQLRLAALEDMLASDRDRPEARNCCCGISV